MKPIKHVLLAGLALAAQTAWAQDATIVGVRIAIGDGPVIQNGHIVVQNGRIVAVGPGRPAQVSGTVIDGTGMTAMPGRVDGHKHINSGRLEKEQMADLIENGFTTVLSGGGPAEGNLTLVQHLESGQINGPNVLPSGAAGGFNQTPEQTRERIRALAAQGIRHTGEMATTPEPGPGANEIAVLVAAVDEGKKAGVQINVHSVSTSAMVASTRAGVRHQVHLPNKDFMSFDDAAYIAGTGTIVLDLISFGAPVIDVYQKDNLPRFRTGLRWPESIAGANRDAQGRATGTEGAYTLINARRLWDASGGRAIGFGSDQNYPVRDVLEHELKSLMVMFSMQDIVRIFTINTATYLGLQNEIGTVTPGKRADLTLVQGNPFDDFHDFLNTTMVFKAGKVVVDKRTARNAAPIATATGTLAPVGTLTAQTARPDQLPAVACTQLTTTKLAQGRVAVAADAAATTYPVPASLAYDRRASEEPVPARCEVTVRRGTGRNAGTVQLWLPNIRWNADLLVLGGGPADAKSVNEALSKGYAVASADAASPVHDVAVNAKALVAAYYGASPRYSYLESRSADVAPTLAAVNANPADFDGLVLGAQDGAPAAVANAPDVAAFAARGGKIIEYHGGTGRAVPVDTAARGYDAVAARSGGVDPTREFYRLFLAPNGQTGDTFRGNWLAALEEWTQRGTAPNVVLVEHTPAPDGPPVQRPAGVVFQPPFGVRTVCAYPMVAMTIAQGTETPEQYLCVTPARAAEIAGATR